MPNLTVSTDVDNFMQAADNAAARTSLGLGTAAVLDAPATGDASVTEVTKGDDTRLTDSRTPLAHKASHAVGQSDALSPADIGAVSTSDVIAIANGGTGATTDSTARTALSAAQSGANTDITSVTLTTGTITGVPGSANDIVNKSYADAIASSINFHEACDYATIAALSPAATYNQPGGAGVGVNATLTGGTNVALQVDGVTVSTTQRILVKNQGSAFENGIYTVTQQGDGSTVPYILTRATDYDTSGSAPNEVQAGDFILVLNSTLANTAWVQQTPAPINFGVTSLTFIQFAAAAAGVVTFSADATGLTPATATNGTVTLGGTLNVGHGGTGATTAGAALTALGAQPALTMAAPLAITLGGTGAIDAGTALFTLGCPAHYVVIRASASQVPLVVAGTYQATLTSSTTVTLTTGDTSLLAIGMTFSATALRNFAIASIVNSTTFTISGTPTTLGSVATSVYTTSNNTFTYALGAQAAIEGRTVVVGDVILFSNQNQSTTTGPWVCTVQGAAGVSQVMTRPSWFTGTGYPIACTLQRGNVSAGQTYSVYQQIAADSDLAIGQVALTASLIAARGSVAVIGGNTFTGKNTLVAGSAILNPLSFQAGAVLTTPLAHAIEWDGKSMYLTTDVSARTTNVVATAIPPTATSTGVVGQLAVDNTGSWLYVCTAANVWKRVLLTTF